MSVSQLRRRSLLSVDRIGSLESTWDERFKYKLPFFLSFFLNVEIIDNQNRTKIWSCFFCRDEMRIWKFFAGLPKNRFPRNETENRAHRRHRLRLRLPPSASAARDKKILPIPSNKKMRRTNSPNQMNFIFNSWTLTGFPITVKLKQQQQHVHYC